MIPTLSLPILKNKTCIGDAMKTSGAFLSLYYLKHFAGCQNSDGFDITNMDAGFLSHGYRKTVKPICAMMYQIEFVFGTASDGRDTVKMKFTKNTS